MKTDQNQTPDRIFCPTCNSEMEIIDYSFDYDENSTTITRTPSCGHRMISTEIKEYVFIHERIQTLHKNSEGGNVEKYRTKTSGETKRPARESFKIDRDRKKRIHSVEEQDENANWKQVHFHEDNI